MEEFWQEYVHVAFDPAHILGELTFTLIFDFLILVVLVRFVKSALNGFKKELHNELDEEHGIPPHD